MCLISKDTGYGCKFIGSKLGFYMGRGGKMEEMELLFKLRSSQK